MRVAAIQLEVTEQETPADRQKRVEGLVADEAQRGADLVLLPELWKIGFFAFDEYLRVAEPVDGPLVASLSAAAARCGVILVGGSFLERDEHGVYNTAVVFGRDGSLFGTYRKIHLHAHASREAELLLPGSAPLVLDVEGALCGLSVCFDLRFPELYRVMSARGVELFLLVSAWPFPRLDAWRTLLRARAIENQAAVIACNSAGAQAGQMFLGHSAAFDAWGNPLGELGEKPGTLRVDLDLQAVRSARREFSMLAARRLEIQDTAE